MAFAQRTKMVVVTRLKVKCVIGDGREDRRLALLVITCSGCQQ